MGKREFLMLLKRYFLRGQLKKPRKSFKVVYHFSNLLYEQDNTEPPGPSFMFTTPDMISEVHDMVLSDL